MKRSILALVLIITLILSLAGCGSAASQSAEPAAVSEEASQQATAEAVSEADEDTVWLPYDESGALKLTDRDATGSSGAVASTSWYASKAGLEILKAGGNAVDAAITVAYTLGVVEPYTSGIGGGGFMTIYNASTGEVTMLDFREMAPASASPDMWNLDDNGNVVRFTYDGYTFTGSYSKENSLGGKSVAVPGAVAGLEYAMTNFGSGTLTRRELIQPAIDYANNGYLVTTTMEESTVEEFAEVSNMPELASYYLDDGWEYEAGTTITNEDLAATLELIADNGPEAFYTGDIAQAIVDAVNKYQGNMTLEDLSGYSIQVREPLVSTYRDYTIYALPPASSGGTHLLEILNILENYDLASMEVNSADYVHLFAEATKIAFADREEYMADTAFYDVPAQELASKEYAASRAAEISDGNGDYEAGTIEEHGSTTSFSVVDKDGNMVSCTVTIGNFYGSKIAVEGYGFILNDEMYDFDSDPESVNCAEAGKRPLSSMAPSVVLYPDGTPFMTIGTPGGTRIFAALAQVIERMIDYDMDIQEAIDSVRIFATDSKALYYEDGGVNALSDETLAALEAMGYTLSPKNSNDLWFGGVQGIAIMKDGSLRAGADTRRSGKALAY